MLGQNHIGRCDMADSGKDSTQARDDGGKGSTNIKVNSDGSLHESKQSATQSDGTWGRVSADHRDNGAVENVHHTSHDSRGNENIISIETTNENLGDRYGNFDLPEEDKDS
jgi:hypothetical protein